jgi:hypothetical protein
MALWAALDAAIGQCPELAEIWLPKVFATLEEPARLCHARNGSIGAFIEDKNSGTLLL